MNFNVIMAGGKGTRFWPLSRENRPKQTLPIAGESTMIQATLERIIPIAPPERTIVITGASHVDEIRFQLPRVPPENVIAEPAGRNTAPCVALAAMIVAKRDPGGIMAVFPADHVVTRPDELVHVARMLVNVLDKFPGSLGTIGIKPAYPETGYGYIKRGDDMAPSIFKVERFLEKPDAAAAAEYVKSGGYYWNAGMFFWRADTILKELDDAMPRLMKEMWPIRRAIGTDDFETVMREVYPTLESQSIDYGVMEKAGREGKVIVAAADPGWNDVGSWRSLYDLMEPDAEGNRARGKLIAVDARGVLAHNGNRLVAVVGVDNVVVVETDDAILVLNREKAQDVRQVTEKLRQMGMKEYL
ncbi:MAG: NTP transferase domain-containing protein [Nitrospinae bacterium]|nr:NTP transferase domain-containing protein [Nitrospinota bacterium]